MYVQLKMNEVDNRTSLKCIERTEYWPNSVKANHYYIKIWWHLEISHISTSCSVDHSHIGLMMWMWWFQGLVLPFNIRLMITLLCSFLWQRNTAATRTTTHHDTHNVRSLTERKILWQWQMLLVCTKNELPHCIKISYFMKKKKVMKVI